MKTLERRPGERCIDVELVGQVLNEILWFTERGCSSIWLALTGLLLEWLAGDTR